MNRRIIILFVAAAMALPCLIFAQTERNQDVWEPFKFFVGRWEGQGEGKPGISKGKQEWQFVLRGKFLQVKNEARFEPQGKNLEGEIHEDLGFFSFDQIRKKFVFRQFHVEGFVNQYVLESMGDDNKTFIFVSEQIENIPPGWKARLIYKILNENEFQQTFDLSAPGKEFECYSKGVMKRKNV